MTIILRRGKKCWRDNYFKTNGVLMKF